VLCAFISGKANDQPILRLFMCARILIHLNGAGQQMWMPSVPFFVDRMVVVMMVLFMYIPNCLTYISYSNSWHGTWHVLLCVYLHCPVQSSAGVGLVWVWCFSWWCRGQWILHCLLVTERCLLTHTVPISTAICVNPEWNLFMKPRNNLLDACTCVTSIQWGRWHL